MCIHYIWLFSLVIICRDVAVNPGLMLHSCHNFLSAHNFIKVSLLRVYVTINKFDIISLFIEQTYNK